MGSLILGLVSRVFIYIAAGVLIAKAVGQRGTPFAAVFIRFALHVLIPAFVFLSLWSSPLSLRGTWRIAAVSVLVMAAGAAFAWFLARVQHKEFRAVCQPVVFMNSAYLAIPVCALLRGQEGVACALIYNALLTLGQFTIGVWWVSANRSVGDIVGLPVVYATVAGIAVNLLHVVPSPAVVAANGIVATVTLPVMLLFMGYRLAGVHFTTMKSAFAGVALRMGGGWISAVAAVWLLGLTGTAADVCVIVSSMPAAVNAFILSEYFGADVEFAAAAVVIGTLLSFAVIPLVAIGLR